MNRTHDRQPITHEGQALRWNSGQAPRHCSGQAMLAAVIFFIFISTGLVAAVASPVLREQRRLRDVAESRGSLLAAESLTDDIAFRVARGIPVSPTETLTIGGSDATAVVTDVGGGKDVVVTGDTRDTIRKIATHLAVGVGVSFNYGIQVGNGGFTLSNNAGVIGNVYANGPIVGSNGAYVTGSAIAANSAALSTDQSNASPIDPPQSITFGKTSAAQDVAQKFTVSTTSPVNKVELYIKKVSTPSNATVRIVADASGVPGSSTLASGTLSASFVTGTFGWVTVVFSSNPELTEGTSYWLVIDAVTNSSKYYILAANTDYPNGLAKSGQHGGSWSDTSPAGLDGYFNLFLGGIAGSISRMIIGTTGSDIAWAHTVKESTMNGPLYCQEGEENNKPCDPSRPDPSPTAFPVSDANIAQWQSDAAAGELIAGSYTISGTTASLGPAKITGNLTITNNAELIITGTLWVLGSVSVSNNAQVNLSPAYGVSSGVVVADGTVSIANNATFSGSGEPGSYIMLLTTNTSGSAISVANNAGTVILNAQKGTISFSNNAGAKEATAYRISMSNNSYVTYESGLGDVNFTSGPSGSFTISDWREVE